MKAHLQHLFSQALQGLQQSGLVSEQVQPKFNIEHTRDKRFGDFACNLAMLLAKPAKRNPRDIAALIIEQLPDSIHIEKCDIAGPGFINIFLAASSQYQIIDDILQQADQFGIAASNNKRVQIEFVSANPTGPLHVGHGRGAAYGAALSNLLQATGWQVDREYYVNDAGRQMNILATSVWLRYLNLCGEAEHAFPSNGYQGDYVWDIAANLHRTQGEQFRRAIADVYTDIAADEPEGGDKDSHIDGLIIQAQQLLGDRDYQTVFNQGLDNIRDTIRDDLIEFGVEYECWFSESSLEDQIKQSLDALSAGGHSYEKDGAIWFRSSQFGDEKDRVLVRDNGQSTYFASDIAYHHHKLSRGYDKLINIWGADHHGYVPRVNAALQALGADNNKLTVLLVQFVSLYRGKQKLAMSTRSGEFITLRELRQEVGKDAARFFYVMRKSEQHMDFDLDLAKSQSNDNPVYYIQYAHARIASVFKQLAEKNQTWSNQNLQLNLLDNDHEQALLSLLGRYTDVLKQAAQHYEPHQIAYYLRELATALHSYYNAHKVLIDDANLRNARLALLQATRQILKNGLAILGVSAPDNM